MKLTQEIISKMHCGLWRIPAQKVAKYMPELAHVMAEFPDADRMHDYVADVKVHMLMPDQFPCIPNWHCDFLPRDEYGGLISDRVEEPANLWLWLSGAPLTKFEIGGEVKPQTWVRFTQNDKHRGTVSEAFQWRVFIRLAPSSVCPPNPPDKWLRRHSQVYLDSKEFTW